MFPKLFFLAATKIGGTGRKDTASEGWIYVLFEGGTKHRHEGGHGARFNLSWLLQGKTTGDGKLPAWIKIKEQKSFPFFDGNRMQGVIFFIEIIYIIHMRRSNQIAIQIISPAMVSALNCF